MNESADPAEAADERDRAADRREELADDRDRIADRRDAAADEREATLIARGDQVEAVLMRAAHRDGDAERRDRAAEARDSAAEAAGPQLDPTDGREQAALDRVWAGRDRDAAASDRHDLIDNHEGADAEPDR